MNEREQNKRVVIVRGIPGAGKSSYARNVFPGGLVVSADHFFMDADGNYRFDIKKLHKAHGQCLYRFARALEEGVGLVIVDNTNTRAREMRPYLNIANENGYSVSIICLRVDPKVAFERGIHGVSRETTEEMAKRLENPLPSHWPPQQVVSTEDLTENKT